MPTDLLLSIWHKGKIPVSPLLDFNCYTTHLRMQVFLWDKAVLSIEGQQAVTLAVLTCQAAASVSPAAALGPIQNHSAAVAQAPDTNAALLASATSPALGPAQAAISSGPSSFAPTAVSGSAEASGGSATPAHVPAVVIAAPVAGGVALVLLLAAVALARAKLLRKTVPEDASESSSPGGPGMRQPLGHASTPALFSDVSMALPKMPIRQAPLTPLAQCQGTSSICSALVLTPLVLAGLWHQKRQCRALASILAAEKHPAGVKCLYE